MTFKKPTAQEIKDQRERKRQKRSEAAKEKTTRKKILKKKKKAVAAKPVPEATVEGTEKHKFGVILGKTKVTSNYNRILDHGIVPKKLTNEFDLNEFIMVSGFVSARKKGFTVGLVEPIRTYKAFIALTEL